MSNTLRDRLVAVLDPMVTGYDEAGWPTRRIATAEELADRVLAELRPEMVMLSALAAERVAPLLEWWRTHGERVLELMGQYDEDDDREAL